MYRYLDFTPGTDAAADRQPRSPAPSRRSPAPSRGLTRPKSARPASTEVKPHFSDSRAHQLRKSGQGGAPAAQRGRTTTDTGAEGSAQPRLESMSLGGLCGCGATSPQCCGWVEGTAETSAAGHRLRPRKRGHGAVHV